MSGMLVEASILPRRATKKGVVQAFFPHLKAVRPKNRHAESETHIFCTLRIRFRHCYDRHNKGCMCHVSSLYWHLSLKAVTFQCLKGYHLMFSALMFSVTEIYAFLFGHISMQYGWALYQSWRIRACRFGEPNANGEYKPLAWPIVTGAEMFKIFLTRRGQVLGNVTAHDRHWVT